MTRVLKLNDIAMHRGGTMCYFCSTQNHPLYSKKVTRCLNIPSLIIILLFGFGGVDGSDQHPANGAAVVLEGLVLLVWDIGGAVKQLQPVFRLVALF